MDYQIQKYISEIISNRKNDENIFDEFIEKCKLYYDRPAHSINEIKEKLNTKIKGDVFEYFAKLYFLSINKGFYTNVWLLKEVPKEELDYLKLKRQDMGIDLIAKDNQNRYYAIQVKYRKYNQRSKTVLGWKQLSTFFAIVNRCGPFYKHIVFTNADYIRHPGGKKTIKDKSICKKSLQNIKYETWLAIANIKENTISESKKPLSLQELREMRLKKFENQL